MAIALKQKVRFGPFAVDLHTGELSKNGTHLKLQPQPVAILTALLEHPGELVTREQLQHRLWPNDTFVDFEQGLNTAIKKLRQALCDEAETPKYIETLPKRGYRFIAEVHFSESDHAVDQDPLLGRALSHYRIVERIGAGGMGVVYRAHDERLDRDVALKILPSGLLDDEAGRQRFRREALALSKLNHPNIAMIFDFDSENGTDFLVEELIEGVSLDEMLAAGPLRQKDVVKIFSQICEGLAAAHEHGIIHRDIKPGNIRVNLEPHVKILDFGLAETLHRPKEPGDVTATVTEDRIVSGTLPYMSPEQLRSEKLDGRTDIWAAGCVLYEMVTGRRPFLGEGMALVDEILNQAPVQASKLNHRVSPGLETIIQKCMEKDPSLRYRSAREIVVDMMRLPPPSGGSGLFPSPGPSRRKWRWIAALGVLLLILSGVLIAVYALFPKTPRIVGSRQLTRTRVPKVAALSSFLATDGSRVYFQERGMGAKWILSQVSTSGGDVSPIPTTLTGWNNFLLGITPSGSELLISQWAAPANLNWELWGVPLPTGAAHRLPVAEEDTLWAVWTKDGSQLVYDNHSDDTLFVGSPEGNSQRRLFSVVGAEHPLCCPRVSPDGTRVRFISTQGRKISIWEVGIDGSNPHPVFPDVQQNTFGGDWTSDGKLYIFMRGSSAASSLWVVREHPRPFWSIKSKPTLLYAGPLELNSVLSSKDSRELFAVGTSLGGELSVYDTQSSRFIPFLGGIPASYVNFSRDGQWIAYVSYPEGSLWKSRLDGTERMQLTSPPMGIINPRWSPDGKFIAFDEWTAGEHHSIYLVPAQGGQPRLLSSGPFEPADPTWSPDSRHIVYAGAIGGHSHVEILDLKTMAPTKLTGSDGLFSPRWSPDGKFIVALTQENGYLKLYDLNQKNWRQLGQQNGFGWPAWSHDSRFVYGFLSPYKIVRVDIATQKSETVLTLDVPWTTFLLRRSGWFDLTPDDRIMILRDTGTDEIYALQLEY